MTINSGKHNFFYDFFDLINNKAKNVNSEKLINSAKLINAAALNSGKVIVIGNGGSAAIASHVSIDLTKAADIRSVNFNEASLLTCFSNDYGYENWVEKALDFYADKDDIVILISSSGQSQNIINGAKKAREMRLPLITLTGFLENNPLNGLGDINFWLDSSTYNVVESVHQMWLLSVVDYLIEKDN
jgi:D-sedoheptulose 7-phosphate isomerase